MFIKSTWSPLCVATIVSALLAIPLTGCADGEFTAGTPDGGFDSADEGCRGGLVSCGSACVDTSTDVQNCGSCGRACEIGFECVAGECGPPSCPVDLQCGEVCCKFGEVCSGGACVVGCEEGTTCGIGMVCNSDSECVDGCFIDGAFYSHGSVNSSNPCQACDTENTLEWTPRHGSMCDTDKMCSSGGQCVDTCVIDGTYYPDGDANPENACQVCDSTNSSNWSANFGAACGTGQVCDNDGECIEGCFIDSTYYPRDGVNEANTCQVCGAESTEDWEVRVGAVCDVGQVCDASAECVDGCFIDGTYYARGASNPTNPCEACDEANASDWTLQLGSTCDEGRKVCTATGECVDGCYIQGTYYARDDRNPSNDCEVCEAGSTASWTTRLAGVCGEFELCNASAECIKGCHIDGEVVPHLEASLSNTCQECDAENVPDGASISADWSVRVGDACGSGKVCNLSAACVSGCFIDGALYEGGEEDPANQCHACDVTNGNSWTATPGLACNEPGGVICDNSGACVDHRTITSGNSHTCGLTAAGDALCWGSNQYGQLGDGTTDDSLIPKLVSGGPAGGFTAISAGGTHTCALTATGTAMCWGRADSGQIGHGYDTAMITVPTAVTDITNFTSISAGDQHNCAVTSDGEAACWGRNSRGQIGNGSNISVRRPRPVTGLTGVSMISAGKEHSCAVAGNKVWCWGENLDGQLGNGSNIYRNVPVEVTGLTSALAVSVGGSHGCALSSDSRVWCWGANGSGQLGQSTTIGSNVPVIVPALSISIAEISAGAEHTCAIGLNGQVSCWGLNSKGQIGSDTTINALTPFTIVALGSDSNSISAGESHTCAISRLSGWARCWGFNDKGQLGNNGTTDSLVPASVTGFP